MQKQGPVAKLEKIIIDSLIARGMTEGEARAAVQRLESLGAKQGIPPPTTGQTSGRQQNSGRRSSRTSNFRQTAEFTNVTAINGTQLAILVEGLGSQAMWIPRSQIDNRSEVQDTGDIGTLIISEWIATQKGLV